MYDIYSNAKADHWRFTLGKSGTRNLITIGLNPSTATREKSDTTVAKVEEVAKRNGFDGFVMLNLYPVLATDYTDLPQIADAEAFSENLMRIEMAVSSQTQPVIWAAWGDSVKERQYFFAAAATRRIGAARRGSISAARQGVKIDPVLTGRTRWPEVSFPVTATNPVSIRPCTMRCAWDLESLVL